MHNCSFPLGTRHKHPHSSRALVQSSFARSPNTPTSCLRDIASSIKHRNSCCYKIYMTKRLQREGNNKITCFSFFRVLDALAHAHTQRHIERFKLLGLTVKKCVETRAACRAAHGMLRREGRRDTENQSVQRNKENLTNVVARWPFRAAVRCRREYPGQKQKQ